MAIRRGQRDRNNIDFCSFGYNDPKIVCQVIRALLMFKGDKKVDAALKELKNHENETVKSVIEKEFFLAQKL